MRPYLRQGSPAVGRIPASTISAAVRAGRSA